VQTSPFSPTPPELRSGRGLPAARSARSPTTLRVVIGDADGTFRRALRASFGGDPGIDVVGEADDGVQALELLRWLRPDVALVDGDMPSFGGAAIARILRTELPETRVVVLTRATAGARR
jgi:DNA-binding NarL/FixJ family response regulator